VFSVCRGGVGVDFTPYLIQVAKENFERPPDQLFCLADALEYVEQIHSAERFTKAMCYGACQTLPESKAARLLVTLRQRFPSVRSVLLGNLPDLDRAVLFWRQEAASEPPPYSELKRHDQPLGIWRTETEVMELAEQSGWRVQISRMPPPCYSSYYRFDATLIPI
jgi:hypothetical protein